MSDAFEEEIQQAVCEVARQAQRAGMNNAFRQWIPLMTPQQQAILGIAEQSEPIKPAIPENEWLSSVVRGHVPEIIADRLLGDAEYQGQGMEYLASHGFEIRRGATIRVVQVFKEGNLIGQRGSKEKESRIDELRDQFMRDIEEHNRRRGYVSENWTIFGSENRDVGHGTWEVNFSEPPPHYRDEDAMDRREGDEF